MGMASIAKVGEEHDTTPTALDFIVYATTGNNRVLRAIAFLAYPLSLAIFYAEAIWICLRIRASGLPVPARGLLAVIGGAILVLCLPGLVSLSWRKLRKFWEGLKTPMKEPGALDTYRDDLAVGPLSPLAPPARLAEAKGGVRL